MEDNYQNNLRPRYPTSYVVADFRSSRSFCSRAIRTVCMASSILSVSPRSHNSKNDLASELEDICPAHISQAIRKQKTVHTDKNKNEWSAVQWACIANSHPWVSPRPSHTTLGHHPLAPGPELHRFSQRSTLCTRVSGRIGRAH